MKQRMVDHLGQCLQARGIHHGLVFKCDQTVFRLSFPAASLFSQSLLTCLLAILEYRTRKLGYPFGITAGNPENTISGCLADVREDELLNDIVDDPVLPFEPTSRR